MGSMLLLLSKCRIASFNLLIIRGEESKHYLRKVLEEKVDLRIGCHNEELYRVKKDRS